MALTLTELMVVTGMGNRRQTVYKVIGDGSSYQLNIRLLKMKRVEAAWTENLNSEKDVRVITDTYDYPLQSIIELGGDGDLELPISDGATILLFVIGY
jgi:hypothetical protein